MPPTIGETKKQKSPAMPLFAVLLFGATFVAGYKVGTLKGGQGAGGYDSGYAAGVAATSERLRTAGLLPEARPTMTLSGTVTSIDASGMVIEVAQAIANPLDEQAPTTRSVRFGEATTFVELAPKSLQEMQKEMEANTPPAIKEGDVPPAPKIVDPFTKKALKRSDIAVGATVTVTAANDILRAEAFDAEEVQLVQRPVPQLGAPVTPDDMPAAAAMPPLAPPVLPPPQPQP